MTYLVGLTQTRTTAVEVEAVDEAEAQERARDLYHTEGNALDWVDFMPDITGTTKL